MVGGLLNAVGYCFAMPQPGYSSLRHRYEFLNNYFCWSAARSVVPSCTDNGRWLGANVGTPAALLLFAAQALD